MCSLGIVQARHTLIHLRRIVHPLGTDTVHRNADLMQLPGQCIPIGAAGLHHRFQTLVLPEPDHAFDDLRRVLRMAPLERHQRRLLNLHERGNEVLLAHVHRQHDTLAFDPIMQQVPVHYSASPSTGH